MLQREQYFFELLKPTYNVWPTVFNAAGRTYTEEQKKDFKHNPIKDIPAFKKSLRAMWDKRKQLPDYKEKYLKQFDKSGTKHSEETKELMRKNRRGKSKSPEMKEKLRLWRLGTKLINGCFVKNDEVF